MIIMRPMIKNINTEIKNMSKIVRKIQETDIKILNTKTKSIDINRFLVPVQEVIPEKSHIIKKMMDIEEIKNIQIKNI